MKPLKEKILAQKIKQLHKESNLLFTKNTKRINKLRCELQKTCTHSETKIIHDNHEGGYDHVAEYNEITKCSICGKELDRKTTYGSYA